MYKHRSTTNSWVMIFSIKSINTPEKIVHISHCCRLFKLADVIFYIYKINVDDCDFEFAYPNSKAKSYGGCTSFKLVDFNKAEGIGNMRHARLDSAFFNHPDKMVLRIKNQEHEEFIIEHLKTIEQKKGRLYPFIEK